MLHPHSFEYEPFSPVHVDGVVSLCRELGWPSYTDPSVARAALSAPGAVTWIALREDQIIGLVHILTNGLVHAHLSLVGVLPSHRRQGVARRLVTEAFRSAGGKWLDLCSEPGSEQFYRAFTHEERSGFRIYPVKPAV